MPKGLWAMGRTGTTIHSWTLLLYTNNSVSYYDKPKVSIPVTFQSESQIQEQSVVQIHTVLLLMARCG
jgi:hypothetical protein